MRRVCGRPCDGWRTPRCALSGLLAWCLPRRLSRSLPRMRRRDRRRPVLRAPQSRRLPSRRATLDTVKAALDDIERALREDAETADALLALRERLTPVRESLAGSLAALESDLAHATDQLKEIGTAPAGTDQDEFARASAPPPRAAKPNSTVPWRARASLSERADDLAFRITDRRRIQFARELFTRSARTFRSVVLEGCRRRDRGRVRRTRPPGPLLVDIRPRQWRAGWIAALVTLAGIAAVMAVLTRWWRRILHRPADTRFRRALSALLVLIGQAAAMPAIVTAIVLVLENCNLLPGGLSDIGFGLAIAVAVASFGRARRRRPVRAGRIGAPARRLRPMRKRALIAGHLTWGARVLGVAVSDQCAPSGDRGAGRPDGRDQRVARGRDRRRSRCCISSGARPASTIPRRSAPASAGLRILLWIFVVAIDRDAGGRLYRARGLSGGSRLVRAGDRGGGRGGECICRRAAHRGPSPANGRRGRALAALARPVAARARTGRDAALRGDPAGAAAARRRRGARSLAAVCRRRVRGARARRRSDGTSPASPSRSKPY